MQQGPDTLSLKQVMQVLRRRAGWIVLCVVLVAAGAYGFSRREPKKYKATASLTFSTSTLSQQIAGLPAGATGGSLLAQQESYVDQVRLGDTAALAARALHGHVSEGKILESLEVSAVGESTVVAVSATTAHAPLSAEIANTYVRQFVAEERRSERAYLKSALAVVKRQLAELTPTQRIGADGLSLQNRIQTLTLLSELRDGNVQVAQEAPVPTSPSSPDTKRNVEIGALIGLLAGLGLAFLLEHFDTRIREAEDLESIYGLPLLGVVPEGGVRTRGIARRSRHVPAATEVFGLIRAHLRFFNSHREVRSVLIASPAPDEGKTTVARHVAASAATAGSHVLLIETDLRLPSLARELRVNAGPGLTDVLVHGRSLESARQSVAAVDANGPVTFDILTAGAGPAPSPAALLESNAMSELLQHARSVYDLVVLDTPPLVSVSDALSLLPQVDGVVVVGWVGRSRRDDAQQLRAVLERTGAPAMGVIVIDRAPSGPVSSYARAASPRTNGSPPDEQPSGALASPRTPAQS